MVPRKKVTAKEAELQVIRIATGKFSLCVLGTSPFICEAMSLKAKQQLLMPSVRLTRSERAINLKHDVVEEFRNSVYQFTDNDHQTRLFMQGASFKKAAETAALDMGGVTKASIGRLMWIEPRECPIYGVPQLFMSVVRSADIARTPDVRTRAIIPQWACVITVHFVRPNLGETALANLIGAAGILSGVGGWRQEKGSGSYGQFIVVEQDDAEFRRVIEQGGRKQQDEALASPQSYDGETARLLLWFFSESRRRDRTPTAIEGDGEGEASELTEASISIT